MRCTPILIGFVCFTTFAGSTEQSNLARVPEGALAGAPVIKDSMAAKGISDSIAKNAGLDSSKDIMGATTTDTVAPPTQAPAIAPGKSTAERIREKLSFFASADTSIPEEDNYYYYKWPRKPSAITVPRKEKFLFCPSPLSGDFLPGFSDSLGLALKKRFQIETIGIDSLENLVEAKANCYVMLPVEISGKTVEYNPGMRSLPFLRAFGLIVGIGAGKKVTEYQTKLRFLVVDCKNQRILFDAASEQKAVCGDALVEDEKDKEVNLEKARRDSFKKAVKDISRKLKIKAGVGGF